ncbi:MAG: hypothetical protein QME35_00205 [Thermoanaerobacteraceae bacterium]|nr:hypothetical protein [Thermoanaerobacteraceae bacterium]
MQKFNNRRLIILIMFAIITGFIAGYFYYSRIYKNYENKTSKYSQIANKKKDVLAKNSMKPGSEVIFETMYKENGEIVREEQKLNPYLEDKSKEEIAKIYKGWVVKDVQPDKIVLYREIAGLPPDYYIISNVDGFVSLLKSDGNGKKELIEKTNIPINRLTPIDRDRVIKNIIVKNIDEAYSILANLSS